ncbi:MAG: hypothetical protein CL661_00960 [Bacteroidetes bacterium]|nr:hypothetical protein [Bacteroidota bacterium]
MLVNPVSVEQIASAMFKISSDSEYARSLVEKGKLRREDFSWERTSENVWRSIEKVILNDK